MDVAWIGAISALGGSALTMAGTVLGNLQQSRKDKRNREWAVEDMNRQLILQKKNRGF